MSTGKSIIISEDKELLHVSEADNDTLAYQEYHDSLGVELQDGVDPEWLNLDCRGINIGKCEEDGVDPLQWELDTPIEDIEVYLD